MNRILTIVACAFLFVCCYPQAKFYDVEVYDSKMWELDLNGRNTAVFALSNNSTIDSLRLISAAVALAERVEQDRQMEAGSIGVYSIQKKDFQGFLNSTDFDKSFVNNLMLSTNADMHLFIEDLKFGAFKPIARDVYSMAVEQVIALPYTVKFTAYDALNGEIKLSKPVQDTVYFRGDPSADLNELYAYVATKLNEVSQKIGESIGETLSKQWRTQNRTLITYYGSKKWMDAYNKAMDFNWSEAIKLWIPLTKSESPKKAAFAAYNIAVACEMSGNLALAKEWINFSLNKHKFQYAIDYSNSLKKLLAN